MTPYKAIAIIEGIEPCDNEETFLSAWQYLVDTGMCWILHGFYGRTAQALIDNGLINPIKEDIE